MVKKTENQPLRLFLSITFYAFLITKKCPKTYMNTCVKKNINLMIRNLVSFFAEIFFFLSLCLEWKWEWFVEVITITTKTNTWKKDRFVF